MTDIIVVIISSVFTLTGTIITVLATNTKTRQDYAVTQAVQNSKIEELTREVREHNNFARRMPVVEEKIDQLEKRVGNIEERMEDKR